MDETVWYHDDSPNWVQMGFLGAACDMLGADPVWQHDDGYKHEITAAAVKPSKDRVAWVECKQ